jgi:hypothetical protein
MVHIIAACHCDPFKQKKEKHSKINIWKFQWGNAFTSVGGLNVRKEPNPNRGEWKPYGGTHIIKSDEQTGK